MATPKTSLAAKVFFVLGTTLMVLESLFFCKTVLVPVGLAVLLAFASTFSLISSKQDSVEQPADYQGFNFQPGIKPTTKHHRATTSGFFCA